MKCITKMKIVIEEAQSKLKKKEEVKIGFAFIGTLAFASTVNVTMFILMKTVIIICRGIYTGITNVETYREKQVQKRTDNDTKGLKKTDKELSSLMKIAMVSKAVSLHWLVLPSQ